MARGSATRRAGARVGQVRQGLAAACGLGWFAQRRDGMARPGMDRDGLVWSVKLPSSVCCNSNTLL
jgi:hypothetical protein